MKYLFFIKYTLFILFISSSITLQAQGTVFGEENIIMDDSNGLTTPFQVHSSDLDGDGYEDIIVLNSVPSSNVSDARGLFWFKNDGTGNFSQKQSITVSFTTSNISIFHTTDLDNDGDIDILAYLSNTETIVWFENDGAANFAPLQIIQNAVSLTVSIYTTDLDNDGDLDLLSAFLNEDKIAWYENDGNENFSSEQVISTSTNNVYSVHASDLDNDGDMDVLSASSQDNKIAWYENDGSGNFSSQQIISNTANGARIVHAADFDNDGDNDVISASIIDNKIAWYENDGNGNFISEQVITIYGNNPYSIHSMDIDNDGDVDILYASYSGDQIALHKNDGNGNFGPKQIISSVADGANSVFASDLDGDNHLDVVYTAQLDDLVIWSKNDGQGNFNLQAAISAKIDSPRIIHPSDLDNDGDIDVISTSFWDDKIAWYKNDGQGNFGPQQIISTLAKNPKSIYTSDLDNDGDMDVLSASSNNNKISWYENDGSGNFSDQQIISTEVDDPNDVYAADLDNDGDMDVLSTSSEDDKVAWYANDGSGNFGPQQIISTSEGGPFQVYAIDMDGDGDLDVLSPSSAFYYIGGNINKIVWYENDGSGNFGLQHLIIDSALGVTSISPVDIDSDGDMDVVASFGYGNNSLAWFDNDGQGNFGFKQKIAGGTYFNSLQTIDMDGDSDIDIIGASIQNGELAWYENLGQGEFSEFILISSSSSSTAARSANVADLNSDGDVDILTTQFFSNKIVWYENAPPFYVDQFATGDNTGIDWQNAFTDLQSALNLGGSINIHIAEGTYYPSTTSDRNTSFECSKGITLLGGYPAGGGNRNPALYETVLSGNLAPTLNGNAYHVVTIKDANTPVKLDGLSIRDGNADGSTFGKARGGGLYINNSTVELNNVQIKWNRGIYGAGLFASLSDVVIQQSTFNKNTAQYGSALYYSNESNMEISQSQIFNNDSSIRCALESNNASNTIIENCIIANNKSTNANAIGFIATNRNATAQITNSTILGETKNKNLITFQIGNNDQLDITINNSIVAHQNLSFNKNVQSYGVGTLNFNHNYCYFQGSSIIGNGTNTLYSSIDGDLLLNSDYSINVCSPVVNNGNDALTIGSQDVFGNPRFYNIVDIGAYEAQTDCLMKEAKVEENTFKVTPNPTTGNIQILTSIETPRFTVVDILGRTVLITNDKNLDLSHLTKGIYIINIEDNGRLIGTEKVVKK